MSSRFITCQGGKLSVVVRGGAWGNLSFLWRHGCVWLKHEKRLWGELSFWENLERFRVLEFWKRKRFSKCEGVFIGEWKTKHQQWNLKNPSLFIRASLLRIADVALLIWNWISFFLDLWQWFVFNAEKHLMLIETASDAAHLSKLIRF